MTEKEKVKNTDYPTLISAFAKASSLSITFVLFPVILLLAGVWLDKRFETTPLFIITGIILGIVIFIFQVRKAVKESTVESTKESSKESTKEK